MASDYHRGEMDTTAQQEAYRAFVDVGVYASAVCAVGVLFLTLAFATSFGWLTSLVASVVVAGLVGVLLKRGSMYWSTIIVLTVIAAISGLAVALISG